MSQEFVRKTEEYAVGHIEKYATKKDFTPQNHPYFIEIPNISIVTEIVHYFKWNPKQEACLPWRRFPFSLTLDYNVLPRVNNVVLRWLLSDGWRLYHLIVKGEIM